MQQFSKNTMLKQLVNAAVQWMKAGLRLRCLKIVLFSRDVSKKDRVSNTHGPLITMFQNLKETYEEKVEKETSSVSKDFINYYPMICPLCTPFFSRRHCRYLNIPELIKWSILKCTMQLVACIWETLKHLVKVNDKDIMPNIIFNIPLYFTGIPTYIYCIQNSYPSSRKRLL